MSGSVMQLVIVCGGVLGLLATVAFVLHMTNTTNVRRAAVAAVAVLVFYPAFLPRPKLFQGTNLPGTRALDAHAIGELVAVLLVAAIVTWLWLTTRGATAAFLSAPLNILACYSLLVLLSLTYTPNKAWATYAVLKFFEALLLLAVLSALVQTVGQLRRIIDVMAGSIAVLLIVYWFDIARGQAVLDDTHRLTLSWITAPNASILAYTFTAVMMARFFTATSRREAQIGGLLASGGALTGLVIGGKTAVISGFVALIVTIVVVVRRDAVPAKLARVVLVLVGMACIGAYVIWANVGVAAHVRTYGSKQFVDPGNLTGRVPVWTLAIQEGLKLPWIGHGYMSTYAAGFDNGFFWIAPSAHNVFVQAFYELGVIGLLLVLLLYIGLWRAALRQVHTLAPTTTDWALSVELLAMLTVLTVTSLTEDIFGGVFENRTMVFLLIGFAICQNARLVAAKSVVPTPADAAQRQITPRPRERITDPLLEYTGD